MTALAELAAQADLPGVDWQELARHGEAHFWEPGVERAYFYQYVLPAYEAATRVFDTLDLGNASRYSTADEVATIRAAYEEANRTYAMFAESAGALLGQARAGALTSPFSMPLATLDAGLIVARSQILVGSLLHKEAIPQKLIITERGYLEGEADAGRIPREEANAIHQEHVRAVAAHADSVVRTCWAIVRLDDYGVFKSLKKGKIVKASAGLGGLGAAPLAAYVVIGVIAVAVILAALYYFLAETDERLAQIRAMCMDAQKRGDTGLMKECLAILEPKSDLARVGMYAVGAAAVLVAGYLVIKNAPRLVGGARQLRSAS